MRRLLALLLLFASPAVALTPEEAAYIAERDKAVAALEQKWSNEAHDRAIAALTPRLKRIVGAPPKGIAGDARMTPDGLCCGVGSSKLDGMAYGEVVVTTVGLLGHWLSERVETRPTVEAGIDRGADIYSTGIFGDAAFELYAPLPIAPLPGTTRTVAHLGLGSQGGAQWPPKDLGVIVWKGDRVFVTVQKVVQMPELPACEAVLAKGQAEVRKAYDAGKSDDADQRQIEAEDAYVGCWAAHAREAAAYPAILKQAQALADAFAAD